jgi:hypothetical protein
VESVGVPSKKEEIAIDVESVGVTSEKDALDA